MVDGLCGSVADFVPVWRVSLSIAPAQSTGHARRALKTPLANNDAADFFVGVFWFFTLSQSHGGPGAENASMVKNGEEHLPQISTVCCVMLVHFGAQEWCDMVIQCSSPAGRLTATSCV